MGVGVGVGVGGSRHGGAIKSIVDSLASQWKMNDASGASFADSIGGRNLTQAGLPGSAAGKIGNCRTFNGTTQYGTVSADSTVAGVNSSFTWSAWVYVTAFGRLINVRNGGNFCFDLRYESGNITAFLGNGTGGFSSGYTVATAPATATWHHVAVAYNVVTNKIKTAINGVVSSESTPSVHPTALGGAILAFMNDGAGANLCTGRLDCIKMWSRYLTDAQIILDYNAGNGVEL